MIFLQKKVIGQQRFSSEMLSIYVSGTGKDQNTQKGIEWLQNSL
jgi:hypothetical protein